MCVVYFKMLDYLLGCVPQSYLNKSATLSQEYWRWACNYFDFIHKTIKLNVVIEIYLGDELAS